MEKFFCAVFYGVLFTAVLDGRILDLFFPVPLALGIAVLIFSIEAVTEFS